MEVMWKTCENLALFLGLPNFPLKPEPLLLLLERINLDFSQNGLDTGVHFNGMGGGVSRQRNCNIASDFNRSSAWRGLLIPRHRIQRSRWFVCLAAILTCGCIRAGETPALPVPCSMQRRRAIRSAFDSVERFQSPARMASEFAPPITVSSALAPPSCGQVAIRGGRGGHGPGPGGGESG